MKEQEPLLTVVVPVSLMAERLQNLEEMLTFGVRQNIRFTVIHDFRDNSTSMELKEIIRKIDSPLISFIEGIFGSPGAARNQGLVRSETQWVAFWDSDDKPEVLNFLEMVIQANKAKRSIAVGSFRTISDLNGLEIGQQILNGNHQSILEQIGAQPGIWRFAFQKEFLHGVVFPDLRMAEDQVFLAKIDIAQVNMWSTHRIVYNYFLGNDSHLTKNKHALEDLIKASQYTLNEVKKFEGESQSFALNLYVRQVVTALYRGNLKTKLLALMHFGETLLLNFPKLSFRIITVSIREIR